jgi:hypothetical protein
LLDATLDGTPKILLAKPPSVPLLIIDDLGTRKLQQTSGTSAAARSHRTTSHQVVQVDSGLAQFSPSPERGL